MLLLHMEHTDRAVIKHARNGREYRLPELPHFSVDGICSETKRFTISLSVSISRSLTKSR